MATILVVDSLAVIREPMSAALEARGFDVFSAATAADALRELKAGHIDLVLLDPAMPNGDGVTLLQSLHDSDLLRRCPIVVLTTIADSQFVRRAAQLGVREYLLKRQFSLNTLVSRIERQLARGGGADRAPTDAARDEAGPSATSTGGAAGDDSGPQPGDTAAVREQPDTTDEASEQLKSLRPLLNRKEMTARIEACGEMKALSPVVADLLRLTASENTSIDHVVKAVKRDQAVALKLLKLANSAVYTRGDPVDSLEQAVLRIGMGSIRQTVMNMAVIDQFGADRTFTGIDPLQFWEHSIACGLIGAEIGRARMEKEPDIAFTMGLLHDVGRLVYIEQFGEEYTEVFRVARTLQLPLERVESKLLLLNHADCMDRILHLWKFPKNLIDPIVFHHLSIGNMRRMASRRVEEVATLGLANRLTHALLIGDSGNDVIYPTEGLCRHLRLSAAVMKHIEETIADQTNEIKFAMLAGGQQQGWKERRAVWRERLEAPLRPLFVSMEPELDAYRVFFDQLTERTQEQANLVVLHIAEPREVNTLAAKLGRMEADAGVTNLPLLVLSPAGDIALPGSITEGRPFESLPTPVTVRRLVNLTRRLLGLEVAATAEAA